MLIKIKLILFLCFSIFFSNSFAQTSWEKDVVSNIQKKENVLVNVESSFFTKGFKAKQNDGRFKMIDTIIIIKSNSDLFIKGKGKNKRSIYKEGKSSINDFSSVLGIDSLTNPTYLYDTIINKKKYSVFTYTKDLVKEYEEYIENTGMHIFGYFPINYKTSFYVNKKTKLVDLIIKEATNFSTEMLGNEIKIEYRFNYSFPNKKASQKYINKVDLSDKEDYSQDSLFENSMINWLDDFGRVTDKSLNLPYKDFEGKTIKLRDIEGWIMIDSWSAFCMGDATLMAEIQQRKSELKDLGINVISLNTKDLPSEYLKSIFHIYELDFEDIYFAKEEELFSQIFPSLILINPKREIVYKKIYEIDLDEVLQDVKGIIIKQ